MRLSIRITLTVTLALALAACGGAAAPAPAIGPDTYASPNLDTGYAGALPVRNQLLLGTLELDGTSDAVTSDQAASLLPLWQVLRSTSLSGAASPAEVDAVLEQIEGAMTAEQLAAIRAMRLTLADLQAWTAANGVAPGMGGVQPGSGVGLSPEARATRQAEMGITPGSSGGNGASTAMMDAAIAYLEALTR